MASARERDGRWAALYRNSAGKQRSAGTFSTEKEALARAQVAELDARPQAAIEVHAAAKKGKPTIAGYGPLALAGAKLEATSRETYGYLLRHIVRELGSMTLAELTPAQVRAFARKLESSEMSSSTAYHVFCVLRLVVVSALQDGEIEKDVTAGISVQRKGGKQKVICTPAQSREIEGQIDPHYALLVRAMFNTGMRYGELMALKSSDIRDRIVNGAVCGKVIKVSRSVAEIDGQPVERPYGKTGRARRDIPVSDDLAKALVAAAAKDGRIFLNTQGRYIRRSNFGRIWKRAVDAIGLHGMTPHGARHSVASWLANDPAVPLVAVRDMLGHSSIAQTSAYIHAIYDGDDPRLAALERMAA